MTTTPTSDERVPFAAKMLTKAADIIDTNGWLQGALIDYDAAADIGIDNAPVCTVGAIQLAAGNHPDSERDQSLAESLGLHAFARWLFIAGDTTKFTTPPGHSKLIAEWNDAPGRTAADVVNRLREAAAEVAEAATW